ncbi:unnamed protein product [Pelagomonas calceolata]|uniref:SAP domain-containing protein n=1 Tax=Pelagomonas calceolata TaxID=35677 RepID=A0A8J2SLU0_9STRA|nr:unnamed protein product [Pelagomonas calceolata]|mmetsp:Transcript_955/g.2729  ORF Transcript_955/g.2729 Transcript_955/m.2729 type:complete len:1021 (-) Transcript_955:52-3114(-)
MGKGAGKGAYGAAVAQADEELRGIMCGAQRSKHTHERGVEKCLALIKTTPEVFADNATEGGFFECVTRVLVAKKRDGGVERCLAFVARVCSGAVLAGDDQQGDVARRSLLWLAKACGAADKTARGRALEVIALVLERLIGEDGAEVDEQVWTALSDAVVPRVHDKVAGVRRAACLALRRLQEDNQPATHALGRALARDSSAEVRAAAARALDPSKKTVGLLLDRCRDVNATVRKAAFDALRLKVGLRGVPRDRRAPVLARGLRDRDAAVRASATMTLARWFVSPKVGADATKLLELLDVESQASHAALALRALHAAACALANDDRREATPAWLRGEAEPETCAETRRRDAFDASFYYDAVDEDGQNSYVVALESALEVADREDTLLLQKKEGAEFKKRDPASLRLRNALLPSNDEESCLPENASTLTPAAALWLRCRVLLELEPSAARLTPSNLEDALAKFSDGDDLARLCSTAGEQAAQEEMKHRENDGESENSDDDEDLSFARTFVAAQVLDCARLLVDHKAIDEAGKVRVADAIDGDFVRTQKPLAECLAAPAARCLAVARGLGAGFTEDGASLHAAVESALNRGETRRALAVAAQLLAEPRCFAPPRSAAQDRFLEEICDGDDALVPRCSISPDADDRELAVLALGRRMLLGDANDSKRIAPHLWRFALNSREGLDVRGRAVCALGDAALAFGCAKCAPDESDFATSLAKLLDEGTAAPLRAVAAEGAAKLLLAGRPLSVDDAETQEARVGASLLRAFLACENDNDEDDDDDDMAAALGGKRRLQQVLSVFFPTLASTRPVSVSRSIETALDDASTPQQAASYVASLPGQQFAAPYALCASALAGTSLRRGEALTTMRAPDDQGEAALLSVVAAGVARAAAEAGEAVAAKAATKFAAACSSVAKGTEADASKDAKNLLVSPFVADAEEAPLPPPPPKAGPKIIAPKAAFDGTDSEPGTAKEAPVVEAAEAPKLSLAEVNKFTVPKLKAALKERGLPVTGLKAVLKARLLEALGYDA